MRKRKITSRLLVTILVITATAILTACATDSDHNKSQEGNTTNSEEETMGNSQVITAEEAYAKMQEEEGIIIVDVRTAEEYAGGHIPNAILIPNETIKDEQPEELPDLDATILIYCRSGNRSAQATKKLVEMGYTNLYDFGGINSWPYDIVTD